MYLLVPAHLGCLRAVKWLGVVCVIEVTVMHSLSTVACARILDCEMQNIMSLDQAQVT